jgi:hypothetical protein
MYAVVAHGADPYLELDSPAYFSDYREALKYAIDIAVVFRVARGRPKRISIAGPDGLLQWRIDALLLVRRISIA